MKTLTLATTIQQLVLAKNTGLVFNFNFGKLRVQGHAQETSVSTDGTALTGELYEIDTTVDFDSIELELLQTTVINSLATDVIVTVTDNRELLFSHLFRTVCSGQALKSLKSINNISDAEKSELDTLNRADTFINDLLPRILGAEPRLRAYGSTVVVLTVEQLASVGVNNLALIARDEFDHLLAVSYKHPSLGRVYRITYNYTPSSDMAGKIVAKLQATGCYRGKSNDKNNSLMVYLSPEMILVDDLEI